MANHSRSKGLQWNRDTPSDPVRPRRDDDIGDEVAYALAELAGRTARERKVPLVTRTVEALRIASAAARRTSRGSRNQRNNETLRTRRSSVTQVLGAFLPAAPGMWDMSSDEDAGDSQAVDPTGCTQCGSEKR